MEDPRMTPKADLPGELFDADEMDRAMREMDEAPNRTEPPAGTWAATARMMASCFPDDGFDWDAWKDAMKERDAWG